MISPIVRAIWVTMTGAKFLLLDEPTEGLAPVIVSQIALMIAEIKRLGYTVLLVEQNARFVGDLADRLYVMDHGVVVDEIVAANFAAEAGRLNRHLGL